MCLRFCQWVITKRLYVEKGVEFRYLLVCVACTQLPFLPVFVLLIT